MDEIIKTVDEEIAQAKQRFEMEFSQSFTPNSTNTDAMHQNVQKLEKKVNHLAKSVYDLFTQLDQVHEGAGNEKSRDDMKWGGKNILSNSEELRLQ